MGEAEAYEFVCPDCHHEIEVDASMKETLLDSGCIVCGAVISESAFS